MKKYHFIEFIVSYGKFNTGIGKQNYLAARPAKKPIT